MKDSVWRKKEIRRIEGRILRYNAMVAPAGSRVARMLEETMVAW